MNLRDLHTWSTARYSRASSFPKLSFAGSAAGARQSGQIAPPKARPSALRPWPDLAPPRAGAAISGRPTRGIFGTFQPGWCCPSSPNPPTVIPHHTWYIPYRRYSVYFCQPPLAVALWRGRALGRDQEMQLSHFLAILSSSQRLMVRLGQAFRRPRFKLFWVR
jgi:hypothetical protein